MSSRLIDYLSQTAYVRSVLTEQADLEIFRQKPTPRMILGLVIIGISYTIGWPLVGLLGILAVHLNNPSLLAIGGPTAYGLSHLTFMLGAWLAGADHARAFFRWAIRMAMLKLTKHV